ncbi:nucleic-acid-binding protein from transposon X-element [Trichonephila clavipes]|uniref:Nucleic-acid-binding protein from transposon X-element n=1 Tax=Trichonephila clavipes TaxID=2585209 RepID=A0A8X6S5L1_TRICX|nr:nucleic-acid-binding protein from transposon X-element [Trichonephila clavipes]
MLKLKHNYREQIKILNDIIPDLISKISGEYIRLYTHSSDEHRSLTHALAKGNDFEYYVIHPKEIKPIKIVIKGLPIFTKADEIICNLEDLVYTVTSCSQLISKRTKTPLPFFLIILPKNIHNISIFDLIHLGYMQVKLEEYFIRGVTQRLKCNHFFHTAANCHQKTSYRSCGKDHLTKNCSIKKRQENLFCINCEMYGHPACYTKCPNFTVRKKGTPINKTQIQWRNSP